MSEISLEQILSACDHTLLKQESTWEQIKALCDDGMKFHTASVCIPPCFVKQAKDYVKDRLAVCTVIGFPNGNMTTAAKVFETTDAVANGVDEIDMVINIGWVKAGLYKDVKKEIEAVKAACRGRILKVIIETCLLTKWSRKPVRTSSRPPRAFPPAARPVRTWRCSRPTSARR